METSPPSSTDDGEQGNVLQPTPDEILDLAYQPNADFTELLDIASRLGAVAARRSETLAEAYELVGLRLASALIKMSRHALGPESENLPITVPYSEDDWSIKVGKVYLRIEPPARRELRKLRKYL